MRKFSPFLEVLYPSVKPIRCKNNNSAIGTGSVENRKLVMSELTMYTTKRANELKDVKTLKCSMLESEVIRLSSSPLRLTMNTIRLLLLILLHCVQKKTPTYVFDLYSNISWSIFILFIPAETGMNTLQYSCLMA